MSTDSCRLEATPVSAVQGTGATSPHAGEQVTVRGVVVANFSGPSSANGLGGFYVQDVEPDGDRRSSEGIFVFTRTTASVADLVQVTGTVAEFRGQTEITDVTDVMECGTAKLPRPARVRLPESTDGELERLEGMLVTVPESMTVSQNYFLGRYGQLTLSSGGRLHQPTGLHRAGSAAAANAAADNRRRTLVLDDARAGQNPLPLPYLGDVGHGVLRAGDTVSGLQGVLDECPVTAATTRGFDYRLQPTLPQGSPRATRDRQHQAGSATI